MISTHDPKTLYIGGNFVFKSTNRGDAWTTISPELTTEKVASVTTIAESPMEASVLYAGTDDGNVWATRDSKNWKNVTAKIPGMPGKRWVSRLLASRYDAKTVFLALDGHRNDDLTTYLFKSTDYGETWKSLRSDLPPATPVRVIREDVKNPNLLFVGTESAAYASIDAGGHWVRLMNHMPTSPVGDLIVHPRDGDLIAATHGRSFWVMDISPLQELTPRGSIERRASFHCETHDRVRLSRLHQRRVSRGKALHRGKSSAWRDHQLLLEGGAFGRGYQARDSG